MSPAHLSHTRGAAQCPCRWFAPATHPALDVTPLTRDTHCVRDWEAPVQTGPAPRHELLTFMCHIALS